jgi:hypothetical protein
MVLNKLLQIALKSSAGDLAKKYTGKTLTNILKSISKNKSNLEGQGIKIAPLKRKVAGAKNKRKDFVTEQDAENRYGTIAQGARKGGKEVPLTNRGVGGIIKGGKAILKKYKPRKASKKVQDKMMDDDSYVTKPKKVMQTIRGRNKKRTAAAQKEHNKYLKSMGIKKRKSGGMIGGSQFVASLYKGDK